MEIGVVGKPNVGKSTLFNALTLMDAAMAPYPFTTIEPNRGIGAVRVPCPHGEKGASCTPGNAPCREGTRWVPVRLLDVPGLVPGAHEGRGLGYRFLDDLRAADGFLQVVDASGSTDAEGANAPKGSVDPAEEVRWLFEELVAWTAEVLGRDFDRHAKSIELVGGNTEEFLAQRLTGLSIGPARIAAALREVPVDRDHPSRWTAAERRQLAKTLLEHAKPRLVAANKCDRIEPPAIADLTERLMPVPVVATAAEAELTLRRAARAGLVSYRPGDPSFRPADGAALSPPQQRALDGIAAIMARWGSTGAQRALETMVFGHLRQIAVFPVEDETRWTDSKGRMLPDVFLVPEGTSARAVAYKVHTDLGENFIRAIDGRNHRALGADHPLEAGTVLRIVSRK